MQVTQLLAVGRGVVGLRQIQGGSQARARQGRSRRRHGVRAHRSRSRADGGAPQRLQQKIADGGVAVMRIGGGHDGPGGLARRGFLDHLQRRVAQPHARLGAVDLVPFDDRRAAHRAIGLPQLGEALARLLFIHVQPDLDEVNPFEAQHLLAAHHLLEHIVIAVPVQSSQRAVAQGAMVPGAENEPDAALGGHIPPIAP